MSYVVKYVWCTLTRIAPTPLKSRQAVTLDCGAEQLMDARLLAVGTKVKCRACSAGEAQPAAGRTVTEEVRRVHR